MTQHSCPGPDRQKPNVPEEAECPECGADLEIWSHDTEVTCDSCKKVITRDMLQ